MGGEFRFVYLTPRFDETVAFWRDRVGLERVGGWDRGPDDRGALFAAADAVVEVIHGPGAEPLPASVHLSFEVDDVDAWHARAVAHGAEAVRRPEDMPWGHRTASVRDPNGFEVVFFAKLEGAAT